MAAYQTNNSSRCATLCRCISEAKERKLKLKLQRYRLQSDIAALQRELKQMKGRLASEQQQQQQLTRQLKQLQHARAARASSTQWHLSSVQLYHNKVVQAAPVTVSALTHAFLLPFALLCDVMRAAVACFL
jgi:chromosome segregation ATPase